jgi:AcrR family transcriptional regulator
MPRSHKASRRHAPPAARTVSRFVTARSGVLHPTGDVWSRRCFRDVYPHPGAANRTPTRLAPRISSVTGSYSGPSLGSPLPPDDEADQIIAAALAVFGENGYGNTTLADIAKRAGVSISIVLRHFASKDDAFRDVVRTTLIGSLSAGDDDAIPAEEPSAVDAVRALARRYWATMERPELTAVVRLVIGELPRFPELAVFHATEALERLVRTLERIIEGGIRRGELHPMDVRAAARTILAALAAHALWFAYPDIYGGVVGYDREGAIDATIETLVRTLRAVDETPPPGMAINP